MGQGRLHLGWAVFGNIDVTLGLHGGGLVGRRLARARAGSVDVVFLLDGVVGLVVLESLVLPATVAAVASSIAVNKLLLSQGVQVAIGDGVSALKS